MENLIEELTKVNPANLSEEGLKLFNKINEIIDRNEELEENNEKYKIQLTDNQYIKIIESVEADVNKQWKSKITEKIEELIKEADNLKGRVHFQPEPVDFQIAVLQDLLQEGDK